MDGSTALSIYRDEKARALQERRISHAQLMAEAKEAFAKMLADAQLARKGGRPKSNPSAPADGACRRSCEGQGRGGSCGHRPKKAPRRSQGRRRRRSQRPQEPKAAPASKAAPAKKAAWPEARPILSRQARVWRRRRPRRRSRAARAAGLRARGKTAKKR